MNRTIDQIWLSSFCMEVHLILKAGMPLDEGVSMLAQDESQGYIRQALQKVQDAMKAGEKVHDAFLSAGVFPRYATDMIGIGEETGRLEEVFYSLSQYYDRQVQLSRTIRDAIYYPAVLMTLMLVVIVVIITKVLPIFSQVFNQLGTTMTSSAAFLMNIGQVINIYWKQMLGIIAFAAILIYVVYRASKHQKSSFIKRLLSRRRVNIKIATARFSAAMAMTLASGLDTDESLAMAGELTDNMEMGKRIENCKKLINDGTSFPEAISKSEILSGLHAQLLSVGFTTGAADNAMEEIARRTQDDAENTIQKIVSKIEPTLVIVMSLIVGLILIAVMLPLVSIMSSIG